MKIPSRISKKTFQNILISLCVFLVALLVFCAIYAYTLLDNMQLDASPTPMDTPTTPTYTPLITPIPLPTVDADNLITPEPSKEPQNNDDFGIINIAVFGMDNRYKHTIEGGRSDVNIILTIDKRKNEIRLTSIMRDTLIYVDARNDFNRINAALVYEDSPEAAVECIEKEFDIDIDHYMITSFVGMAKIIDAIGGVNINITKSQAKEANILVEKMNPLLKYKKGSHHISSSGNIRLSGIQAVAYMRLRKSEGGFARDTKQKEVLLAARESLSDISLEKANKLIISVSENVKTDMNPIKLLEITMYLYACRDGNYTTIRIPLDNTYNFKRYKGMAVIQYDKDTNLPQLHDFIYDGIAP